MSPVPPGLRERVFPPRVKGRLVLERFDSDLLRDNPLGDPHVRDIAVYTPPGADPDGLPLLVHLSGFAGAGWAEVAPDPPYGERLFGQLDRMIRSGACRPCTVVAPDGLTSLGSSQYVDSTATGAYASHILEELLPWARERFSPGGVGVLGQSSGGFGALHLALESPGSFDAVASSAGDMGFEGLFPAEFAKGARALRARGGPEGLLRWLAEPTSFVTSPFSADATALLLVCCAACYSPRAGAPTELELPFDWESGELRTGVWKRWLAFDPAERLRSEAGRAALRRLRSLHLTASRGDEWGLDAGARLFAERARHLGVPVVYDETEGGHFDKAPRYERMLPRIVNALAEKAPE